MLSDQRGVLAIILVHTQVDTTGKRSFIFTEIHPKVTTDLLVERFGNGLDQ